MTLQEIANGKARPNNVIYGGKPAGPPLPHAKSKRMPIPPPAKRPSGRGRTLQSMMPPGAC